MATVSKIDEETDPICREHTNKFIRKTAASLAACTGKLLELGPQERSLVKERFTNYLIDTFDIVDTYNPTFVRAGRARALHMGVTNVNKGLRFSKLISLRP